MGITNFDKFTFDSNDVFIDCQPVEIHNKDKSPLSILTKKGLNNPFQLPDDNEYQTIFTVIIIFIIILIVLFFMFKMIQHFMSKITATEAGGGTGAVGAT